MRLVRVGAAWLLAALLGMGSAHADATSALATGVRQVNEGDFAGAILTLDPVARGQAGEVDASLLSQTHLYLGLAHLSLLQEGRALEYFKDAVRLDPGLQLGKRRYSRKVLELFEEARRAVLREQGVTRRRSVWPFAATAAVVAAATIGAAQAKDGIDYGGRPVFSGARFLAPVAVCPDGSANFLMPVSLLFEVNNATTRAVPFSAVSTTVVIVASAVTNEVGFESTRPSTFTPSSVPPGSQTTVRVDTTFGCANPAGDASRSSEGSARLRITTPEGSFSLDTVDRLRIDVP